MTESSHDLNIDSRIQSMLQLASTRNELLFKECFKITRILESVLTARVIDRACDTTHISPEAANVLDSAHVSAAIHGFFVSEIFKVPRPSPLPPPPRILQDIGAHHWNMLSPHNVLADRDVGRKPSTKVHLVQLIKKNLYSCLNWLVLNMLPQGKGRVCYGYLYNLEWTLNLKFLREAIYHSFKGRLFRIDTGDYSIPKPHTSDMSTTLRLKLAQLIGPCLQSVTGIETIDKTALADYIAHSVPITHLEHRLQNFSWATDTVKKLNPKTFVSAMAIMYEGSYVFLAAAGRQCFNSTIVGIQHGGSYGYFRGHNHVYNCEYRTLDYFISWGWTKSEFYFGPMRANVLALGSHYLRRLASEPKRLKPAGTPTRILLVPGNFFARDSRCDQNFDEDFYINTVFPLNAAVLVKLAKSLGASVDFKGGYPTSLEPQYFKILKAHCDQNGVVLNDIGMAGSVCMLFDNYDLILFEVIGTSPWEALAKKNVFLFLPSAKIADIDNADEISELLYAQQHMHGKSLQQIHNAFCQGVIESQRFLGRYGKLAEQSFWSFLDKRS